MRARGATIGDSAVDSGAERLPSTELSTVVSRLNLGPEISLAQTIRVMDETLRALALQTGEAAFLRAANALHHQQSGRPSINDGRLIQEARWLVTHGKVKTLNQALCRVARTVVDEERVKAVAERLRRKMHATDEKSSTK